MLFHWLLIPLFHLDYARIKWQWFFIIISDHMKFYIPFPNAPYWEILLSIQKCNGGYSNVQPQPSKVTPFSKYECEKVNLLLCYFLQISLSKWLVKLMLSTTNVEFCFSWLKSTAKESYYQNCKLIHPAELVVVFLLHICAAVLLYSIENLFWKHFLNTSKCWF